MIWGMTLHPGVVYTREVTAKEYFTMASLDCRTRMNKGGSNPVAHVLMKTNFREIVLCTLEKGTINQQGLNFLLQPGEHLTLSVEGTGVVYVSGYTVSSSLISNNMDIDKNVSEMVECSEEQLTVSCPQVSGDLHNDGCMPTLSDKCSIEGHEEIPDNCTSGHITYSSAGEQAISGSMTKSPEPLPIAERWDGEDAGSKERLKEDEVASTDDGTVFIKLEQLSPTTDPPKDSELELSDKSLTIQRCGSTHDRPQSGTTDKTDIRLTSNSISHQRDETRVGCSSDTIMEGSVKKSRADVSVTKGAIYDCHQEDLQRQNDNTKEKQSRVERICLHTLEKKRSKLEKRTMPAEIVQFQGEIIEKQFKCKFCPKSFSVKTNLICHERIHTGERPYECQFCSKAFSTARNLRQHVRIHTGEKPFPCHLCGKSFARKFTFDCHMNSHSGVKPFKCQFCVKCFANKQDMTRHQKTHTGEKPYDCQLCGKSFTRKSSLNYHVEKLHSSVNHDIIVSSE